MMAPPPRPSSGAPAAPVAPGIESAPKVLQEMQRLIDARFGTGRAGMGPFLEELGQGLAALLPGPGEARLTPEAQQASRAELTSTLDTLEDVLEAFHRSGRARNVTGWGER
ncbi:hypothetical protein OV208_11920 [Corallococcus sp. bb12-1]|uniref:hypothetical protein n=1 Tax=Corallococcus sp. bb12-1 TaxID=2996784 RepID=UPI0022709BA6|nr:hypothetical protein [Corallococcus sp. bb12-1]MCY1042024.1 hypothetical protein [Corallococcus sp. bb12-1]